MSAFSRLSESLDAIMNREDTPLPDSILGKRTISEADNTGDEGGVPDAEQPAPNNESNGESSCHSEMDQNILLSARRYVARKKFKPDVNKDIEQFLGEPIAMKLFKLYVLGQELKSTFATIQAGTPVFAVSEDLKTNIRSFAHAVLLTPRLSSYRDDVPADIVCAVVKTLRLGLPDNIEHIPADWAKVEKAVAEQLVQARSLIKRAIKASLEGEAAADHQDIYKLTQALANAASITVTIPLCARVALMRFIYETDPSTKYWLTLDAHLTSLRKKAGGAAKKLARVFKSILEKDAAYHGHGADVISSITEEEVVDERQQQVDDAFGSISQNVSAPGAVSTRASVSAAMA